MLGIANARRPAEIAEAYRHPGYQKYRQVLNKMIDRDREEPIPYRSQRKFERNPFGRFDYQGLFGFDDMARHLRIIIKRNPVICKTSVFPCV